jgi:hypothetical protein
MQRALPSGSGIDAAAAAEFLRRLEPATTSEMVTKARPDLDEGVVIESVQMSDPIYGITEASLMDAISASGLVDVKQGQDVNVNALLGIIIAVLKTLI